jgi:predicted secreted protein
MSAFAAKSLNLEIASMDAPTSFLTLNRLLLHRVSVASNALQHTTLQPYAWNEYSDVTEQFAEIEADCVFGVDDVSQILRSAVFDGSKIMARITLPDASTITGAYVVMRYDLIAEEGDIIRCEFLLKSSGELGLVIS